MVTRRSVVRWRSDERGEGRQLFDLRLVDWTTGLPCSVYQRAEPTVFGTGKHSRGTCMFMKISELEALVYVRDDCLTIECVRDVIREPEASETKALSYLSVPPSDLSKHRGKLLEEQEGVDFTFSVQGEDFSVHKKVLTMLSPVFKGELYGLMRKKEMRQIAIDDMQPAVFKDLLHFIYTDALGCLQPCWLLFDS